jgi:3-oxoacyl-[acyl-carrier-protein] synthase III
MKQIVRKAKIIGTGSFVPGKIYTNEYLASIVETDSQWIEDTLGI